MTKIHNQEQLIAAAEKVFLEKGYLAARVEDIGAELGVLQGSLYYHIGSKAGLLRLVLRHRFGQMTERVVAIAESDATTREKIYQAVVAQLHFQTEHLPDSRQWFESPGGPKETNDDVEADRRMVAQFRAAWQGIIAEGIARGEIRAGLDPDTVALSILGASGYVKRWHEGGDDATAESIAKDQLALLWSGISTT